MKPALKNILAIGMLLFLGLHFILILNYAAPVKAGGKLNTASVFYCYPYFHQQWAVFVPAPKKQFRLYMRAGKDGDWQPWFSLSGELIQKNRRFPGLGAEPEVLLLTNAMNYLYTDLDERPVEGNALYKDRPSFPSFAIVERAAKHYFHHSPRSKREKEFELLFTATDAEGKMQAWYFKNLAPL